MKISVVIVSYNEEKYISQAIDSCLQQKYDGEVEIIVGDDGSNDGSIDILNKYTQMYPEQIKYFVMDRPVDNKVVPSFRVSNILKRAFAQASGDYIICLSGDDYFCDDMLFQKQSNILQKDRNMRFAAAVCAFKNVWDSGEELLKPISKTQGTFFWGGDYMHISCFMFRRETTESSFMLQRFCDDTGLAYSIICNGKLRYISDVAMCYRQRDKSIMHEADILELNILELMLYQDVVNNGRYSLGNLVRFCKPIKYVYKNREDLKKDKYQKYLDNSKEYENNILGELLHWEGLCVARKVSIMSKMLVGPIMTFVYRVLKKIYRTFVRLEE